MNWCGIAEGDEVFPTSTFGQDSYIDLDNKTGWRKNWQKKDVRSTPPLNRHIANRNLQI